MSDIIPIKKSKSGKSKRPLNPTQKTFNRLKKQIETLQIQRKEVQQELDRSLEFYLTKLKPKIDLQISHEQEHLKLLYEYYKKPKTFTKKQQSTLKELLLERVNDLGEIMDIRKIDPVLKDMISSLTGENFDEQINDILNETKEEIVEQLNKEGIDIDLSKVDFSDLDKMRETAQEAYREAKAKEFDSEDKKSSSRSKAKTKKQLAKEAEIQKLEQLQKKGLSSIYKQLAKSFHPDLEQDPIQKAEKEKLMKRLTSAYENNDLHTLLALEIEWINKSEQEQIQNEDQLKLYNSILKDQVEVLKEEIEHSFFNPKYQPMYLYLENIYEGGSKALESIYSETEENIEDLIEMTQALKGKNGKKTVQSIIKEYDMIDDIDLDDLLGWLMKY